MKTKEGHHMLCKRNVPKILIGLGILLASASATLAAPHHHGHGLSLNASHRHSTYQVHSGYVRSHGFHGHHRYHGHRYGLGAVTLGVVGGTVLGAAIAHAASPVVLSPAPIVYSHPVVVSSSLQSQSFVAVQSQPPSPAFGSVYSALPSGCTLAMVQDQNYYRCGSYWYLPQFGPQGVQYLFVAPPQ